MKSLKTILMIGLLIFVMSGVFAYGENAPISPVKTSVPVEHGDANGTNDTDRSQFYLSAIAGKKITLEGKLFRSKMGLFLICNGFSVFLHGFSFESVDPSKKIKLTGRARIYRSTESKEEWEERVRNEPPFTHTGYIQELLVLEAEH